MRRHWAILGMCTVWAAGCGGDSKNAPPAGDSDTDTDTDSDTDADADTDTDTETDTGTGTGTDTDTDTDTGTGTGCGGGEVDCGGECVDTQTDEGHCGACDAPCGDGLDCTAGVCLCAGLACLPGESCVDGLCDCVGGRVDCGGVCADVSTDVANCGGCGVACPVGGECAAGVCRCPEGLVNCVDEGVCADLASDEANCGGCGDFCSGECISGVCDCGDLSECDVWGGGTVCTDTAVDPTNCGSCGDFCGGGGGGGDSHRFCADGGCVCRPTHTECDVGWGDICFDLQADDSHCGACATACAAAQVCSAGVCVAACPEGSTACDEPGDGDAIADYCTNTDTDPLNCGGCSNAGGASGDICESYQVCVGGGCTDWVAAYGCDNCGDCDECPGGWACCTYPGDDTLAICVEGDTCP